MSEPKPEVVTRALVQDVQLPADGGTLALVTLDNGHDHTKPNTFGLEGMAGLSAAVATLQQRAEAGEIVAVAVTGKPFIFAVGADLSGVPGVASREQALGSPAPATPPTRRSWTCRCRPSPSSTARRWAAASSCRWPATTAR